MLAAGVGVFSDRGSGSSAGDIEQRFLTSAARSVRRSEREESESSCSARNNGCVVLLDAVNRKNRKGKSVGLFRAL